MMMVANPKLVRRNVECGAMEMIIWNMDDVVGCCCGRGLFRACRFLVRVEPRIINHGCSLYLLPVLRQSYRLVNDRMNESSS
jgi:hypothetical protein